jgi:hypothetical protein
MRARPLPVRTRIKRILALKVGMQGLFDVSELEH